MLAAVGFLLGVPLLSLIWKAGLGGSPPTWSAVVAGEHIHRIFRLRSRLVLESLSLALLAGCLTTGLALVVCWLSLESHWLRAGALSLVALVWAVAAPIVGLGLKAVIAHLLDLTHSHTLAVALYYGPSFLPAVWVDCIRFFPFAVALLWPVVRLLPVELRDAARIDGAKPRQELRYVILPLTASACLRTVFAVSVLSLGELGAGKLVDTPGSQTFAHEVFTAMHYGVTNDLAALCLVLLGLVVLGSVVFQLTLRLWRESSPELLRHGVLDTLASMPNNGSEVH
jgi:ABC-type Fe3+ transport system permease subunit